MTDKTRALKLNFRKKYYYDILKIIKQMTRLVIQIIYTISVGYANFYIIRSYLSIITVISFIFIKDYKFKNLKVFTFLYSQMSL